MLIDLLQKLSLAQDTNQGCPKEKKNMPPRTSYAHL